MAALDLQRFIAQPVPDIGRILSRLDRAQLAQVASVAIDLLDSTDDDPDLELSGDEADGDPTAEDEFAWHGHQLGPGCPVSDPDCDEAEALRWSSAGGESWRAFIPTISG